MNIRILRKETNLATNAEKILRGLVFGLVASSALLTLGLSPAAGAQDLLGIYQLAKTNDMTWAGAYANYQANIEKGSQGRALLLPSLVFTAGTYKVDQEVKLPSVRNSNHETDVYAFKLTQPLYRRQNFAAYAQGVIGVSQAEAELAIARQDLILRVAQTYFDVLAAEDSLSFAKSEKAAIAGQLSLAERNFSVGNATVVDVHEARARYDLVQAQEVNVENDLQIKRETLTTLINVTVTDLAKVPGTLSLQEPQPADVTHWLKAAQAQNLQIKVQERIYEIAQEEVARSRGGHHPTLDLVASHSYNDTGGNTLVSTRNEAHVNQIGLELQVPLFQGGATQSKVRESLARQEQARDGLNLAKRQTELKTRSSYLVVTSGIVRVRALEQAAISNKKALESTLLGYEAGVRTGIDVLNAQRDLYRIQRDLSQARYAYLIGRLQLKAAAGILNEDDVLEINSLLTGG